MKITGEVHEQGVKLVVKANIRDFVQFIKIGYVLSKKYTIISLEKKGLTHTVIVETKLAPNQLISELKKMMSKSKLQ